MPCHAWLKSKIHRQLQVKAWSAVSWSQPGLQNVRSSAPWPDLVIILVSTWSFPEPWPSRPPSPMSSSSPSEGWQAWGPLALSRWRDMEVKIDTETVFCSPLTWWRRGCRWPRVEEVPSPARSVVSSSIPCCTIQGDGVVLHRLCKWWFY